MDSKEFLHDLFDSITIIHDGRGNVYSIGDQVVEKLGYSKDFIRKVVPEEFIISLEDVKKYGNIDIEKLVPEKYNKSDTLFLKEPGTHILIASSDSPLARDLSIWMFSEIFPRIRGHPQQAIFY